MNRNKIFLDMKISVAGTYFKRLKGLMFRSKPIQNEGLLITPCGSIHMFFMKFPIDVVFVDKNSSVVDIKHNLQPWKVCTPNKVAYATLELPVGTIEKYKIAVGDKIANL